MLTYVFHSGLGHPVHHLNTFLWWSCQQQWRTKGRLSFPSCGERGKFSTSNFPIMETPENVPAAPLLLQGLIFMGCAVKPGKERALLFFILVDWWKFTLRWRFPFWGPAVPRAVLLYYSRRIISWYSTNSYVPFTSLNLFQIETNPSIFSLRTYACGIYPLCCCAAGNCLLRYWWHFPPPQWRASHSWVQECCKELGATAPESFDLLCPMALLLFCGSVMAEVLFFSTRHAAGLTRSCRNWNRSAWSSVQVTVLVFFKYLSGLHGYSFCIQYWYVVLMSRQFNCVHILGTATAPQRIFAAWCLNRVDMATRRLWEFLTTSLQKVN